MGKKRSIIFFGELPPKTIHGASISSKINLDVLRSEYDVESVEEYADLRYHSFFSFRKLVTFCTSWMSFIRRLFRQRYDFFYGVIYLSSAGIIKNTATVLFFKLFNPSSRVVLHFHRSDIDRFLSAAINRALFRFVSFFVWKYILLSETQIGRFPAKMRHKLAVLYNTIEQEFDGQVAHKDARHDEIRMIYMGNYILEKGIFDLIDAVKKYNLTHFIKVNLQCFGNFSVAETEKQLRNSVGNDPCIVLNPPVSGARKFELLKHADMMALPSYNEGLPISLLESISLGIPMIITKVGFIPEALGDDYPFYCDVKRPESIVACIQKYLDIDDKTLLAGSIKHKYQRFSKHAHAQRLLEIFAS